MTKFNDGVNGVTSFGETRLNNINRELRNGIENSGQAINDGDDFQISKAMANNAAVANFYTDSGTAGVYVLTPIDNFQGLQNLIDGATVRFRAGNLNPGASNANVNGTGVKNVTLADGTTALSGGEIPTDEDTIIRFDEANDVWIIQPVSILAASETVAGILQIATQSQTNALTDDLRAVPSLKMGFGFAISLTVNGYIKFPSWLGGLIFQWGSNSVSSVTPTNISLPLTFGNNHFQSFASYGQTSLPSGGETTVGFPQSLSQIQLNHNFGSSRTIRWFVVGN